MFILRKILFFLFLLIYVIFCPILILRALGIVFEPESQKNIVKTGLIYASSIPSGASVYLNDNLFPEKTPAIIRNLPQGDYAVKLVLLGHLAWEKTVPVEAEQATTLKNILLIPHNWEYEGLSPLKFDQLIPLYGNNYLLFTKGEELKDIFIYRWHEGLEDKLLMIKPSLKNNEAVTSLFSSDFPYLNAKILSYYTVGNSPFILFCVDFEDQERFLWVDLREKIPAIKDITDFFPTKPQEILWLYQNIFY